MNTPTASVLAFPDNSVNLGRLTNCIFSADGNNTETFPINVFRNQPNAQLNVQSECENDAIADFEISNSYHEEFKERAQHILDLIDSYNKRIRDLKQIAVDDGISLNPASHIAFIKFFSANPALKQAGLIVKENGNLRAIWECENEAHVALQFLGDQTLQYVIFKQRKPQAPVSRVSGRDTMDGIMHQFEAFDLKDDLYCYGR